MKSSGQGWSSLRSAAWLSGWASTTTCSCEIDGRSFHTISGGKCQHVKAHLYLKSEVGEKSWWSCNHQRHIGLMRISVNHNMRQFVLHRDTSKTIHCQLESPANRAWRPWRESSQGGRTRSPVGSGKRSQGQRSEPWFLVKQTIRKSSFPCFSVIQTWSTDSCLASPRTSWFISNRSLEQSIVSDQILSVKSTRCSKATHLTAVSPLLLPIKSELRKKLLPTSSPRTSRWEI